MPLTYTLAHSSLETEAKEKRAKGGQFDTLRDRFDSAEISIEMLDTFSCPLIRLNAKLLARQL